MQIELAQRTDTGNAREENQDDLAYFIYDDIHVFIVADGMGGEAGGRAAAKIAISTVKEVFDQNKGRSVYTLLQRSISVANQRIHTLGVSGDKKYKSMGSTIVILVIHYDKAYTAHVGDSRIYLYRKNLQRKTKDHSAVQRLVDNKEITEDEANEHPDSNKITRSLGHKQDVEPEITLHPFRVQHGDILIICSDGLCGFLKDFEIEQVLSKDQKDLNQICWNLVNAALQKGGDDNTTVQVVRVSEPQHTIIQQKDTSKKKHKPKQGSPQKNNLFYILLLTLSVIAISAGIGIYIHYNIDSTKETDTQVSQQNNTGNIPPKAPGSTSVNQDHLKEKNTNQLRKDISIPNDSKSNSLTNYYMVNRGEIDKIFTFIKKIGSSAIKEIKQDVFNQNLQSNEKETIFMIYYKDLNKSIEKNDKSVEKVDNPVEKVDKSVEKVNKPVEKVN